MNWITIQYLKSIFYQCYDCFKTVYLWGEIVAFASLSWFAFKLFLQFALIACKCKIVLLKILNALNDLFFLPVHSFSSVVVWFKFSSDQATWIK